MQAPKPQAIPDSIASWAGTSRSAHSARTASNICGPPPMLEAVRALCAEREVPAQLAMESGMACGFGACMGCVVTTADGYLRLCVDGPVVDAARLDRVAVGSWQ